MPLVADIPIGNNGTLIKGLSDRSADLEARRVLEGVRVNPAGTPSAPYTQPALISGAGAIVVLGWGESLGPDYFQVSVDGAAPVALVPITSSTILGYGGSAVNGIILTGLTPGWHNFTLSGTAGVQGGPFSGCALWPL